MVNFKSGEVSWTDTAFNSSKRANREDTWLRLNPGSNIVRLLTLPHQYHQHKFEVDGGKKYGYRIRCSQETGACPICEKQNKPKRRWYVGVIDRQSNTYKILDIGYAIFKDIQKYARDDDWGDPSRYDIDIVVNPKANPNEYYAVVAKPLKPLSANDLVLREQNNPEDIIRMSASYTYEKVSEKLKQIMDGIHSSGSSTQDSTGSSEESSEEDEDNFFKNYSEKK